MSKFLIVARILLGLMFLAAAGFKMMGAPTMVVEFEQIGLGQGFRYLTAVVEIAGALLLIRPRTVTLGAAILVCVCIGAGIAQVAILHGDLIHCVVMGAFAAWVGWSYRHSRVGAII